LPEKICGKGRGGRIRKATSAYGQDRKNRQVGTVLKECDWQEGKDKRNIGKNAFALPAEFLTPTGGAEGR